MRELVISRHHGEGLWLAEESLDERTVQQQLREFDPSLRLTWEYDAEHGLQVWNVHKIVSADRPAVQILTWRANGAGVPLPLTSRLVEEVKRLRAEDTAAAIDRANQKIRDRAREQAKTDAQDIAAEHAPYVDRNRVQITTAPIKNRPSYLRTHRTGS